MGTAQVVFVGDPCGGSTGSHVTGSGPEPEVTSVTRKHVLRMRNRKLRNILRSRAPEVTQVM